MGIQCCLPPNKPKVLCLSKAAMNSPVGWFFSCFSVLNAHSKLKQLWGGKKSVLFPACWNSAFAGFSVHFTHEGELPACGLFHRFEPGKEIYAIPLLLGN